MVHSSARLTSVPVDSVTALASSGLHSGGDQPTNVFGVLNCSILINEPLAQIKLNPISVEQFLMAAKSLADNNSGVQSDLYDAIERARSSSLLIDHLRALFSHQQAVEYVRAGCSEIPLSMAHETLMTSSAGADSNRSRMHRDRDRDFEHTQNLALFSYSNQRTLIKAAKLLIASVAKILYIADSIVLQIGAANTSSEPASDNNNNNNNDQLDEHADYYGLAQRPHQLYAASKQQRRQDARGVDIGSRAAFEAPSEPGEHERGAGELISNRTIAISAYPPPPQQHPTTTLAGGVTSTAATLCGGLIAPAVNRCAGGKNAIRSAPLTPQVSSLLFIENNAERAGEMHCVLPALIAGEDSSSISTGSDFSFAHLVCILFSLYTVIRMNPAPLLAPSRSRESWKCPHRMPPPLPLPSAPVREQRIQNACFSFSPAQWAVAYLSVCLSCKTIRAAIRYPFK